MKYKCKISSYIHLGLNTVNPLLTLSKWFSRRLQYITADGRSRICACHKMYIYLFIFGVLNDAVGNSDYKAPEGTTNNESEINWKVAVLS
jgi:hypothetical protein